MNFDEMERRMDRDRNISLACHGLVWGAGFVLLGLIIAGICSINF